MKKIQSANAVCSNLLAFAIPFGDGSLKIITYLYHAYYPLAMHNIDVTHQPLFMNESVELLSLAFGLFPNPVFIIDRQRMKFSYVNEMAVESTGYTPDELLTFGLHDLDQLNTQEALALKFDEMVSSKKNKCY
jgi:PAS domain-containing protein